MSAREIDRRQWLVGATCFLGTAPALARAAGQPAQIVRTPYGAVRGAAANGVLRFLGIPYGQAPGRFERIRPAEWSGVRDALAFGPIAPQLPGAGEGGVRMDEACQVLNVYTPALDGNPRPVMFWCHGGGFQSGSASTPRFDGTGLALAHDVVVVTINHRLGPLGALRLDHLDSRFVDAGRVGMLDIVDALNWVQRSIGAFGGDPRRVMVFGQSGGGGKVLTLLAMPEACSLFHRAIVQSGTMRQTSATADEGAEATARLTRELGLAPNDLEGLRDAPLKRLLAAQAKMMETRVAGVRPFSPVIDGRQLPEQPFAGHAPACSDHIPIVVGSTTEELRVFNLRRPELFALDAAGLRRELLPILGPGTDSAIAAYRAARPRASASDLYFNITADEMYWSSSLRVLDLAARRKAPVYSYRFAFDPDRAKRTDAPSGGAGHGAELGYVFRRIPPDARPDARELARVMSGAWASFAATGKPEARGLPHWPAFTAAERRTMIFDAASGAQADPYRAERLWWTKRG